MTYFTKSNCDISIKYKRLILKRRISFLFFSNKKKIHLIYKYKQMSTFGQYFLFKFFINFYLRIKLKLRKYSNMQCCK